MTDFAVSSDLKTPGTISFLGIGVTPDGTRHAVMAHRVNDRDIAASPFDAQNLDDWMRQENSTRGNDPAWLPELKVLRHALREVYGNTKPKFTVDDDNETISLRETKAVIAAPSATQSYKTAACEVAQEPGYSLLHWIVGDPSGRHKTHTLCAEGGVN